MKLPSALNPRSAEFVENERQMQAQIDECDALAAKIQQGGGEQAMARHISRGKLPPRERVAQLCAKLRK